MLTPAQAETRARAWCDAWNRRDLEAVLDHYAPAITLRSPLVAQRMGNPDGVLHGIEALRGYFAIGMRNPALSFTFEAVLLGQGAMTILYRRETGRLVADTMILDDDSRALAMTACYEAAP